MCLCVLLVTIVAGLCCLALQNMIIHMQKGILIPIKTKNIANTIPTMAPTGTVKENHATIKQIPQV